MNGKNVAVVGLWHLGTVTATCLATQGNKVIGIDPNETVTANLSKGVAPIYEPGLEELVKECEKKGNLSFTNDFRSGLKDSDYVIIAFDTPIDDQDRPDLSPIMDSITKSIPHLREGALIIVSSQVPIGTCEEIRSMVVDKRPSLNFGIACMPENLKLGEAISRFNSPDLLVIGAETEKELAQAEELYSFASGPKLKVNLRTAEMVKHALNAFLACQVSFANELGNLCDSLGVDSAKVTEALHLDPRIGKKALLNAGLGFGGGTLARDVGVLRALGEKSKTNTTILDAIMQVNSEQNKIVASKLRFMFGRIRGLNIGVLGLTYKPGTSTIRRSTSIEIIKELVGEGAVVKAYDPKAEFEKAALGIDFERCESAAKVAKGSDALLILTGWPEFKEINFAQLKSDMTHPLVIDPLGILDLGKMESDGFIYMKIGKGQRIKPLATT